jgi:hypothetical protein
MVKIYFSFTLPKDRFYFFAKYSFASGLKRKNTTIANTTTPGITAVLLGVAISAIVRLMHGHMTYTILAHACLYSMPVPQEKEMTMLMPSMMYWIETGSMLFAIIPCAAGFLLIMINERMDKIPPMISRAEIIVTEIGRFIIILRLFFYIDLIPVFFNTAQSLSWGAIEDDYSTPINKLKLWLKTEEPLILYNKLYKIK